MSVLIHLFSKERLTCIYGGKANFSLTQATTFWLVICLVKDDSLRAKKIIHTLYDCLVN